MKTLEIIFFILLFIVFYTYIGYAIVLWCMVQIKKLFGRKRERIPFEESFFAPKHLRYR